MRDCAFVPPGVDDPPIERSERLPSRFAPRGVVLDLRFGLRSEFGPEDPRGVRAGDGARLRPDEPFGFATSTLSTELDPIIPTPPPNELVENAITILPLLGMAEFSSSTCARDVVAKCGGRAAMAGRVVLVTGSNSGIGLETAIALASTSAVVICACRSDEKCARAIAAIGRRSRCMPSQLRAAVIDLSSLRSVRAWADDFVTAGGPLHVLVNNAGVMQLPKWESTADGFEAQFGINFLAPWLLTQLLLPTLQRSAEEASEVSVQDTPPRLSRVVNVSSIAHRHLDLRRFNVNRLPHGQRTYSSWEAYASSKLLQIVHARSIGENRAFPLVGAIAVHPGVVKTNLGRHQASNPASYTWWIYNAAPVMAALGMGHKSAAAGAAPSVRAAMDDSLLSSCVGNGAGAGPGALTSAGPGERPCWIYLSDDCRPATPRLPPAPAAAAAEGATKRGARSLDAQLDARATTLCAAVAARRGRARKRPAKAPRRAPRSRL